MTTPPLLLPFSHAIVWVGCVVVGFTVHSSFGSDTELEPRVDGMDAAVVDDGPLDEAWAMAESFLSNDANQEFADAVDLDGVNDRERRFGEAMTLLNVQPRTSGNIERSEEMLEELIAENPGDDPGIFAQFFLGRLHQMHAANPDLPRAAQIYRDLFLNHPGHPLAEFSASVLALATLYSLETTPEQRSALFDEYESWIPRMQTAEGRRDLHLILGRAGVAFGRDRKWIIEQFLAADAGGIPRRQDEVALWTQLGELARLEGNYPLAREYFEKVVKTYRRHNNYYPVLQLLNSLPDPDATAPDGQSDPGGATL